MKFRIFLAIVVGSLIAGCATGPSEKSDGSEVAREASAEEPADVQYTLDVGDAAIGRVAIEIEVRRPDASRTAFGMEESWGGLENLPSLIGDVRATDGEGAELPVTREGTHWVVEHSRGATVRLRYRLSNELPEAQISPTSLLFVPRISGESVFVLGPVAFLRPGYLDGEDVVTAAYRWRRVPEDWRVISSVSTDRSGRTRTQFSNALRVFMYAGRDLRVESRSVKGNNVHVAFTGEWPFEEAALADLATEILAAQREFFDDHRQEYFAIASVPLDVEGTPFEGAEITSGTGLHQSLATFLVPETVPERPRESFEVKHLLGHELFHNWNGVQLLRMPEEREARIYWFTEGFTEHMTREILFDAGLIDRSKYLEDLNGQIAAYLSNPLREITNDELAREFWKSEKGRRLAYQRGAMVALDIDHELRERSDGTSDVGDLMRRMRDTEMGRNADPNEYVFERLAEMTDQAYADRIRRHVLDGEPLELDENLLGDCYRLSEATLEEPRFGFELETSLSSGTIRGVEPDSPAAEAGLEDGQTVTGVEKVRREGELELHVELRDPSGASETKVVQPEIVRRTVPKYEYDADGCPAGD